SSSRGCHGSHASPGDGSCCCSPSSPISRCPSISSRTSSRSRASSTTRSWSRSSCVVSSAPAARASCGSSGPVRSARSHRSSASRALRRPERRPARARLRGRVPSSEGRRLRQTPEARGHGCADDRYMGFNLPSLQRELRKRRVAVVFVTLALADCVAYVAMRGRGDVQAGLYQLTGLACVAGLMLGRRRAGARGFWWLLFPAAVTLDVTGDAAWLLHDSLGLRAVPARLSDGLYLGAYPVFAASLLCIGGARRDELSMLVRDLVDAGIVFCAGLPVLWFAGIDPVVGAGGIHGGDEILAVTYPILDLVLLALLLRLAFSAVRWSPAYLLLTTGFAATFVGDIVWRELLARGSYGAGSCVNVLFLAGYGLWGAAALEPSAAMLERTAAALSCVPPRRRLLLLAVAVATPGIVIPIAHHRLSGTIDVAVLAACAASIPLLGLVRTADMVGSIHEALRHEQEARAALGATIAAAPVPVCVIGEGGAIRLWNAAAEEMSGWRAEEIVGRALASLPGQSAAAVLELYRQALAGVRHRAASARLSRRNGDPVDLRISTAVLPGADSSVVAMFEDVTAELRQAERLEYLAAHDPLTGLANRRKFEAALEAATAGGERAALVFFDLDNFKLVND